MSEVKRGDVIIHCRKQMIVAISVVEKDAYTSDKPPELENDWTKEGWRVDSKYTTLEKPLFVPEHKEQLYQLQPEKGGPLNVNKSGKEGYLYEVNEEFYDYIVQNALTQVQLEEQEGLSGTEIEIEVEDYKAALLSDDMLVTKLQEIPNTPRKDEYKTKEKACIRNAYLKELVKRFAGGRCQLCGEKAPFFDRNDRPYLEEHHVQALGKGGSDTMDNVVALCPNCHRKVHIRNELQDQFVLQMAAGRNDKRLRAYLERMEHEEE